MKSAQSAQKALRKANNSKNGAPQNLDLDGLYDAAVIAAWMHITKPTLLALVRKGKIPVVRLNERLLRFHPKTILHKA